MLSSYSGYFELDGELDIVNQRFHQMEKTLLKIDTEIKLETPINMHADNYRVCFNGKSNEIDIEKTLGDSHISGTYKIDVTFGNN